jgi:cAMP phosphodiesterase
VTSGIFFITNPFNKDATEKYLDHISPNVMTTKTTTTTICPPFKIYFESMTVDVGRFDPFGNKDLKRRYIDARHYNMSVIRPKMVYLLSSTIMNAALHKGLGKTTQDGHNQLLF